MILVTGGTGNIGSSLVKALQAAKKDIRVLTRDPSKAAATLGADVPFVAGDLGQPETLGPALAGAEKAFFVAQGGPSIGKMAADFAAAAKTAGVKHVVAISSSTIEFDIPTAIGRWHRELEEAFQRSGVAWTFLRPGNFASNSMRWAPTIKARSTVFATHGNRHSAPIDPADIAAVAAAALTGSGHEGKTYTLTGPELLTARQQAEIIGRALGRAVQFVEVPVERAREGMLSSGYPAHMVDAVLELMEAKESALTSTVKDVTGHEGRKFEAWAQENVELFR